jgi:hypothetical protein
MAEPSTSAEARPRDRGGVILLVLVFALALTEALAHFVEVSRVPTDADWTAALGYVRAHWQEGDAISSAPRWADPIVRWRAGDLIDDRMAGRSDLDAYRRLWTVSIRGARADDAPHAAPEERHAFGEVRVERWTLPTPRVTYDFTEHVAEAHAFRNSGGVESACRLVASRGESPGGLAAGPQSTPNHHSCDRGGEPWLWVGETVNEDLELRPRHCIYQHPVEGGVISLAFDDVPLGDSIVLYSGVWWEFERTLDGAPLSMVIRLDGEEIGRGTHRDGDGWSRMEAAIPEARRGGHGTVRFEVSTERAYHRTYCWAATMRGDPSTVASALEPGAVP